MNANYQNHAPYAEAVANDVECLIAALDYGRQIWEQDDLVKWLSSPQSRWQDRSPLEMIAAGEGETVLDILENTELYS